MKTLRHLELSGYKSIEDVKIDLNPGINVFIGPNGSGKSNLMNFINQTQKRTPELDSVFNFKMVLDSNEDRVEYSFAQKLSFSTSYLSDSLIDFQEIKNLDVDAKKIDFTVKINDKTEVSKENISPSEFISPRSFSENVFDALDIDIEFVEFKIDKKLRFINSPYSVEAEFEKVIDLIDAIAIFEFPIILPLLRAVVNGDMNTKGKLSTKLNARFKDINEDLLKMINKYSPVQDIRFKDIVKSKTQDKKRVIDNIQLEFKTDNSWYNWRDLSDGTQRILAIIERVHSAEDIVLIEEPELGVHPHQLMLLMEFLTEISEEKQIIISTHSPDVLEYVTPLENINVVSIKKGKTHVRKLTKKQREKAQVYLEETGSIGDFWRHSDLEI